MEMELEEEISERGKGSNDFERIEIGQKWKRDISREQIVLKWSPFEDVRAE